MSNKLLAPLRDEICLTNSGKMVWQQERCILETTELICELMEKESVSRTDLAQRLSKSKGHITKLLDGSANMTLRTASDIFVALGYQFIPSVKNIAREKSQIFHFDYPLNLNDFGDDSECEADATWGTIPLVTRPSLLSV